MSQRQIEVRKSTLDLTSFEDITLVKQATMDEVETPAQALERLGNDHAKLMQVINDGLEAQAEKELRATVDGWHTFKLDAEGEETEDINGPFTGQTADSKKVNNLILSLAKSMFDFNKGMTKDQKRSAKEQAKDFVKSSDAIRAGLAKSAVAAPVKQ